MYRVALCDDDQKFLEMLEKKIKFYCKGQDVIIQSFNDSYMLMSLIESDVIFDAYILDIEMCDYSGIRLAQMIKERSKMSAIIFLTAYDSYAVKVCGMHVFRYVMKECMAKELPMVLEDLFVYFENQRGEKIYQIMNQRKCIRFFQREIVYITKAQKNAVFHKADGHEEYDRLTLNEVYRKLDNESEMYFADRGLIVNLFYVQRVEKNYIEMYNGMKFYFNISRINEIKRRVSVYWGNLL